MAGFPIRKHELEALEGLARGQAGATVDEAVMARLISLGLVEARAGTWRVTSRGTTDLTRRKSLKRSTR